MLSIGLMSGTSMDGIDAALLKTDGEHTIIELGHIHIPYAPEVVLFLKSAERAVKTSAGDLEHASQHYQLALQHYLADELHLVPAFVHTEMARLTRLIHTWLQSTPSNPLSLLQIIELSTRLHARAVQELLLKTGHAADEIDVIGYHGQTLFHQPARGLTIQIGDGALLADLTHISVINDFRQNDVAAGGQGAPFAPLYHLALSARDGKIPAAIVNCGGIANVSLLCSPNPEDIIGFDTGPGNGLIDALVKQHTQGRESMDKDAHYGLQGSVQEDVLEKLFESILIEGKSYFLLPPPKSLDIRDLTLIPELNELSLEDACATLAAFTAEAIVRSLTLEPVQKHPLPPTWILAGGGGFNPLIKRELLQRLNKTFHLNATLQTAHEAGWNNSALEAQIFAYFAVRSSKNLPLSMPNTTGVSAPMSGGTIHHPAPVCASPKPF